MHGYKDSNYSGWAKARGTRRQATAAIRIPQGRIQHLAGRAAGDSIGDPGCCTMIIGSCTGIAVGVVGIICGVICFCHWPAAHSQCSCIRILQSRHRLLERCPPGC